MKNKFYNAKRETTKIKLTDKEVSHIFYTLYEVLPNGKRIYINTFYYRGTAQSEKVDYENCFPWKKYCIIGGGIKCK